MRILLNGKWHVVLEDGTTGQMDLPGTLDENGIGHRDVGANQWHPDAVLGNAAGEIDKDALRDLPGGIPMREKPGSVVR